MSIVDAIIDQELEAQARLEEATGRLDVSKRRLRQLIRKVFELRDSGRIGQRDARKLWLKGFTKLALLEYVHDMDGLKTMVDKHLVAQVVATAREEKPLHSLPPVRNVDIKARMVRKAEK